MGEQGFADHLRWAATRKPKEVKNQLLMRAAARIEELERQARPEAAVDTDEARAMALAILMFAKDGHAPQWQRELMDWGLLISTLADSLDASRAALAESEAESEARWTALTVASNALEEIRADYEKLRRMLGVASDENERLREELRLRAVLIATDGTRKCFVCGAMTQFGGELDLTHKPGCLCGESDPQ